MSMPMLHQWFRAKEGRRLRFTAGQSSERFTERLALKAMIGNTPNFSLHPETESLYGQPGAIPYWDYALNGGEKVRSSPIPRHQYAFFGSDPDQREGPDRVTYFQRWLEQSNCKR